MPRAEAAKPPAIERQWKGAPTLEPLLLPLDSIHRDPANARKHGERNLSTIKASLARFGQQRPLLVDGDSIIRAGNGTHEAAEALGWSHVAAVVTDLKGSEATAYAITDNRAAELAEWADEELAATLEALRKEEFDLSVIGYLDDEVAALLGQLSEEPSSPSEFAAYDESIETEFCCPKCSFRWSGKPK